MEQDIWLFIKQVSIQFNMFEDSCSMIDCQRSMVKLIYSRIACAIEFDWI